MEGVMTNDPEDKSAIVPVAQQAEAVAAHSVWRTAKPHVWTERMLTALVTGVKGGKWFRLIDKVYDERNLTAAFRQVEKNGGAAGVDHVSVREFAAQCPENIWQLSDSLRARDYDPSAIRRKYIPKPGTKEERPLGIPTVRDRTVQTSLLNVIEPIFEHGFAEHSYGFRPKRGCRDALGRVDQLIAAGYVYVVDADLKAYFDTIPHDQLMKRIETKISDGRVLELIQAFLTAGIMDGLQEWIPTQGAPQGAVLSPLLSNIYLDPLDHLMAGRGFEMVRYADDFVILCRSPEAAAEALQTVQDWVTVAGLTLHPTKTRIVDSRSESFAFLGYEFLGPKRFPRKKSIQRLRDAIRRKTRRLNGASLQDIIADCNRTLRGWYGYFKENQRLSLFKSLDGWIRRRLRTILRRRSGRRGLSKGRDHQIWPNDFFADLGLFCLLPPRVSVVQSSRR
jgi:RNA-directed DNA polymerase